MSKLLLPLLSWLAIAVSACATPDRVVHVKEDFLGSNEEGFVLLRTETDNLGSYYSDRAKHYLDEYEKTPTREGYSLAVARRAKSTLILDTTHIKDPDGIESETTHSEDATISLAALLKKYPAGLQKWKAEQLAKIAPETKGAGIRAGRLPVVSDHEMTKEVFGSDSRDIKWMLEEAAEDMNCIYLKVSTGIGEDETSTQIRWVCNVPKKSQEIRDHLNLEPMCLVAGRHETVDLAVERARSILAKAKELKQNLHGLEVWKISQPTGNSIFSVVLRNSMRDIQPERFERLKNLIGMDLAPSTTQGFIERIDIHVRP